LLRVILHDGALFAVIGLALVFFLLASWVLKIEGFNELLRIITRKLGARSWELGAVPQAFS
jgi:hypothetical protein